MQWLSKLQSEFFQLFVSAFQFLFLGLKITKNIFLAKKNRFYQKADTKNTKHRKWSDLKNSNILPYVKKFYVLFMKFCFVNLSRRQKGDRGNIKLITKLWKETEPAVFCFEILYILWNFIDFLKFYRFFWTFIDFYNFIEFLKI